MPTSSHAAASPTISDASAADPLAGIDSIIVIDNGAHNIRIASIPYPFPSSLLPDPSSSIPTSIPSIDPRALTSTISVQVYPNAIARTRTTHLIPSHTSPIAPAPGTKTSIFVSSHIHTLLDGYAALHLRLPHQSGVIVDWAAQKTIWDHVLTTHLANQGGGGKGGNKGGKLLAGKAVVITEAYLNPEPVQYAIDLMLFEQYGAQAVWRTTGADLIGLGTDVFSPSTASTSPQDEREASPVPTEDVLSGSSPKRSTRPARSVNNSVAAGETSVPRIISPSRPQSLLVVDLGYSFCHIIPIINGQPHQSSIRRLELGGKMLINLLKETLSFGQLDMMDESWLMSHIFSRVSFVASEVGRRVYGAAERVERELERIGQKNAKDWSYEDLLLLEKYGKRKCGKKIGVTWTLPDYRGAKGGKEDRERARYGYILDGPNPTRRAERSEQPRKKARIEEDGDDSDSAFIATSSSSTSSYRPSSSSDNEEEEEEKEDLQSLTLSSERFSILENLFNPSALGLDQKPLPELMLDSITSLSSTSPSLTSAGDMMWSNIVLTGGLANAVGMKRRLENELRPLAPADVPVKIWPEDRELDKSLIAIKAGVLWSVEASVREAVRRERRGEEEGGVAGKKGRKGKTRGRKSVSIVQDAQDEALEAGGGKGRWMTYAQWSNPPVGGGGAPGEVDIVHAANRVFYPPSAGGS